MNDVTGSSKERLAADFADEIEAADVETIMQGDLLARLVVFLRTGHLETCDVNDSNIEGIKKPCNCPGASAQELQFGGTLISGATKRVYDHGTISDDQWKERYGDDSAHEPAAAPAEPLSYGAIQSLEEARDAADTARREGLSGYYPAAAVVLDMAYSRLRHALPPAVSDNPNEGPIVNGLVQIADGVLPPFNNRWKCSQCGRDPQDVQFNGCGYSQSCGRTATLTKESAP